jgi:Zn-dependent peptidase ImmA (M78 family)
MIKQYPEQQDKLVKIAKDLGCEVSFTHTRAIAFNINMIIFVHPNSTIETIYAFAHEIGHLIDYKKGILNYEDWKNDSAYRINAEMSAWVNAYELLKDMNVPLEEWNNHVAKKLSTYFEREKVS